MSRITARELALLHHTLGLSAGQRAPTRNHFVASASHAALTDLEILEAVGFVKRTSSPFAADQIVFRCTFSGEAYALAHLPQATADNLGAARAGASASSRAAA
jgi:succinylarginine dihydrolase